MKYKIIGLLICYFFFPVSVNAATENCKAEAINIEEKISKYLITYWDDCIHDKSEKRLKEYGISTGNDANATNTLVKSLVVWKEINEKFSALKNQSNSSSKMNTIYKELAERAASARKDVLLALEDKHSLPDKSPSRAGAWQRNTSILLLPGVNEVLKPIQIFTALDTDCSVKTSALCSDTLSRGRELILELDIAKKISSQASNEVISRIANQVTAKNDEWNTYLYDSKPMLPLDIVLTDFMNGGWSKSDNYPNGFRLPPKTQWFLLHPSIGMEYVKDAIDGEQLKPILILEIGANRWNEKDRWIDLWALRQLSGFSITVSYADRSGIKDKSDIGALFTFDNVYSIGFNKYGNETGISFSVDLANLWRDKYKSKYQKFKDQYN